MRMMTSIEHAVALLICIACIGLLAATGYGIYDLAQQGSDAKIQNWHGLLFLAAVVSGIASWLNFSVSMARKLIEPE